MFSTSMIVYCAFVIIVHCNMKLFTCNSSYCCSAS